MAVIVKCLAPATTKYAFAINNLDSISIDLQSPVTNMPLPESPTGDKENILVKAEGNTLRINLSWTLIKEPSSVVTATLPTVVDSTKYPTGVKTPDEQARFLIEDFQSVTLLQQYQVILVENNLTRLGSLEGISLSKSGSTPVTWKANLKFISGDVVTVGE